MTSHACARTTIRSRIGPGLGLALSIGFLVAVPPAQAATTNEPIVVTNTASSGPGSLLDAAEQARARDGFDVIEFAPGVEGVIDVERSESVVAFDASVIGPGAELLTIRHIGPRSAINQNALIVAGSFSADPVTVSGLTLQGADGVGVLLGPANEATVSDVVVEGAGDCGVQFADGAETNQRSSVVDVTVRSSGCGLYDSGSDELFVSGLDVEDVDSAGIRLRDTTALVCDVTITRARQGIVVSASTTVDVERAEVSESEWGLFFSNGFDGGQLESPPVTINESLFTRNDVGVAGTFAAGLTVDRTVFAENDEGVDVQGGRHMFTQSTFEGNGIAISASSFTYESSGGAGTELRTEPIDLVVRRSTFSGNGRAVSTTDVASFEIENSTFAANGPMAPFALQSTDLDVTFSTLSTNTNDVMFELSEDSLVEADHVIVSGNGGAGVFVDDDPVTPSSFVSRHGVLSAPVDGSDNIITDDPGLQSLSFSGGVTASMSPADGSVALDGGASLAADGLVDQRGNPRGSSDGVPNNGRLDVGAVERIAATSDRESVVSVDPVRVLDTRRSDLDRELAQPDDCKPRARTQLRVPVVGIDSAVPVDAEAVAANVTAVRPGGRGFLTVHPCLDELPLASSLNYRRNNIGNQLIAPISADGSICVYTEEVAHLTVDIAGYVPAGSSLSIVDPTRLVDTRPGGITGDRRQAAIGRLGADDVVPVEVGGRAGVPESARAAVLNVTAVNPAGRGFLTVYSCDEPQPLASALNFERGVTRANEVITTVGPSDTVCVFASADVDLVVDVVGFVDGESGLETREPVRIVDTRVDGGDRVTDLSVDISEYVGSGGPGMFINVTAVNPEASGFLSFVSCTSTGEPLVSSLNYSVGENGGNELFVSPGRTPELLCLRSSTPTHITLDLVAVVGPDR